MDHPHLQFHHFGIAIRRPDEARKFVAALGYELGESVFDPARIVHSRFATHATQPAVEIHHSASSSTSRAQWKHVVLLHLPENPPTGRPRSKFSISAFFSS